MLVANIKMRDLARLLLFIDEYDAVIGYRLHRQDLYCHD
jgi:hypothetical protein